MICSLVAFCLIAVASPGLVAQEKTSQRVWSTARNNLQPPHPAVVRIIADDGNSTSYGSGTLVAHGEKVSLVITNWHVIRDAKGEITVAFPDGFRSSARIVKEDRVWDLAALVIWRSKVDAVPIANRAPRPGDPLTIAGYGSGQYRRTVGKCTQYVAPGLNLPYEMVEVSAEARQGDSGGPIFNEQGELAGVLFGAGRGTTSGSYSGRLQHFLVSLLPQLNPVGQLANAPQAGRKQIDTERFDSNQETVAAEQQGQQQLDQQPAVVGGLDHGYAGQEPIPDPDQAASSRQRLASLPKQIDPETLSDKPNPETTKEVTHSGLAGETASSPEFRLVPLRSPQPKMSPLEQQQVSADSETHFKMVPVSEQSRTTETGWQKIAKGNLFQQVKDLMAMIGLFYFATLLVGRRD